MSINTEYSNSILDCRPTLKWNYSNTVELAPNCPRCASSNTKFCYYNNYSLSQPRYFCKGCRRYWTKGGSLRNVPVGGGCRKTRRSRAAIRQPGGACSTLSPGYSNESESGTSIDLAAVFAKYVNQNVGNEDQSFSPGGSSGSSQNVPGSSSMDINGQNEDVITMFEYQNPMDLVNGGDDQIHQVLPQISMHQEIDGRDFVYQDCSAFDMQRGVLGDELAAWSEGTDLPSFGSQLHQTVEAQDFGLFSPDEQFRNWGSFDLSAYEIFSTI